MERFWQRLPGFRSVFEPLLLFNGESFTTLSVFADNPTAYREVLETVAAKGLVLSLMAALEASRLEGNWEVL